LYTNLPCAGKAPACPMGSDQRFWEAPLRTSFLVLGRWAATWPPWNESLHPAGAVQHTAASRRFVRRSRLDGHRSHQADMGTLGGFASPQGDPAGFPRDQARVFRLRGRMICSAEFAGFSLRIDARHAVQYIRGHGFRGGQIGLWPWYVRRAGTSAPGLRKRSVSAGQRRGMRRTTFFQRPGRLCFDEPGPRGEPTSRGKNKRDCPCCVVSEVRAGNLCSLSADVAVPGGGSGRDPGGVCSRAHARAVFSQ
jgi:hypothetical protein